MKNEKKYKVLMAVDPTETELRPTDASLSWFKKWVMEKDAEVEAVFVSYSLSSDRSVTELGFSDYVKSMNLGNEVKSKILFQDSTSRRKAVEALVEYSKAIESDLIVVSSHGRSGPGRLVLGSFAESVLALAPVPVLFLCGGLNQVVSISDKILFPTDLSGPSKFAFNLLLEQLNGYQGELVIYNAVSPPGAIFDTAVLAMPVYLPESYWLEQKQWIDRETDLLLKKAAEKGMRARVAIQDGVLNTPLAIERFARDENVGLIAMASVSRGLESVVLGSVAKGIFRLRKWPVWVYGPEAILKK